MSWHGMGRCMRKAHLGGLAKGLKAQRLAPREVSRNVYLPMGEEKTATFQSEYKGSAAALRHLARRFSIGA